MRKKKKSINDFEKSSSIYFSEISNFSPLSKEEEKSLWERYKKQNDISARDKIIKSNLKFVASVAKPYIGMGLSYPELIAEGNLGLMKAIDKFDYELGNKTISYSVWWIRQTILEALNKRNIINGDDSEFKTEVNEEMNTDDIVNESYSEKYSEDDDTEIKIAEEVAVVANLLDCLNDREREVIKDYYGIDTDDELTLEEIGKKFNLTKERIRQIKESALKKLRNEALKNSITSEIYN